MLKIVLIILIILIVLLILVFLESYRELRTLKLTTYDIKAPGITKDRTIVFLSDYHEARQLNKKIVDKIDSVKPDIILVGGDMINGRTPGEMQDSAAKLLNELAGKYPLYYAYGNHERKMDEGLYNNKELWKDFLKSLSPDITFLLNKSVDLGDGLRVYGLDTPMKYFHRGSFPMITKDTMNNLLGEVSTNEYTILLGHAPDLVDGYTDWGAELTLAGHFHGGLIRLPLIGGVASPRIKLFPKYDYGLYEVAGKKMIVTNGLGQHSLKVRLGNTPEIVQVNLKKL